MDIYPPIRQRPRLLELLTPLDARPASLRRDECSDWAIFGKHGHIYAVPLDRAVTREGFQLVFGTNVISDRASNAWSYAKARLPFCRVSQDGDGEGCMMLDRMPSAEESLLIRRTFGIPKARHMGEPSAAQLQVREKFTVRAREAREVVP